MFNDKGVHEMIPVDERKELSNRLFSVMSSDFVTVVVKQATLCNVERFCDCSYVMLCFIVIKLCLILNNFHRLRVFKFTFLLGR